MQNRRLFLQRALTATVSAPIAAKHAVDHVTASTVSEIASVGVRAAYCSADGHYLLRNPAMQALIKSSQIPKWARDTVIADTDRDGRIDTNVACLKSVSLGSKCRISHSRRVDRMIERSGQDYLRKQMIEAFFENIGTR